MTKLQDFLNAVADMARRQGNTKLISDTNEIMTQVSTNQISEAPAGPQEIVQQSLPAGTSQIGSKMYVFPEQPTGRYDFMVADGSSYIIDLKIGIIQKMTGGVVAATTQMNIDPLLLNNVNSILLFVSDADTIVKLDQGQVFNDHKLFHRINNLNSKQITIFPPSGKLPALVDLNFVLSNEDIMPYDEELLLTHTKKTNTKTPTTDGFADIAIFHMGGYAQASIILQETGGVNSMDWQVLVSIDDVNYFPLVTPVFATIAASGYALFVTDLEWHFYKVQVKNHTAGQNAAAKVTFSPIR